MDKTLNTWLDLYECAVISDENYLTLNLVTYLKVCIECIPRVLAKLLETESDALLRLIKVEDNDIDLLVESNYFLWMVDTSPREVCDVDKSVYATEVNEYTVTCDVLDSTLEYLTLLELTDDLALLLLELSLDKCLVRNDNITELLVDLNDLEVHIGVNILIVVADRLDVDL